MNPFHSIRTRLTVLVTLVAMAVSGGVSFIEANERSVQTRNDLLGQIDALLDVQVDALSVPLWNFDQDEVERQLGVLVTHGDIVAAVVVGSGGAEIARADGSNEPQNLTGTVAESVRNAVSDRLDPPATLTIERDIRYGGSGVVGELEIVVSEARLAEVRSAFVWSHVKEFVILSLVITLTMALAVRSLVRPVLEITEAMDDVARGDIHVKIPATERRDEIGKMARALQVFQANAEQLEASLERERELNGLQRQFVSMVSHEFRTPLAVIDGNAQRLLRRPDPTPERLTSSMKKVRSAITNLTELMESVLNASRLEEGRIGLEPDTCCLTEMMKELCDSYAELNAERSIHVDIGGLPELIVADRKLLRQVFSNLLSNAIKYSPDGKNIWVKGWLDDDDLAISIRDEGVGIPAAELDRLCSRFFRASTSTGIAGSGIGLHLVKHFVNLHRGVIDVQSQVGEGTTFTVRMPYVRPIDEVGAAA